MTRPARFSIIVLCFSLLTAAPQRVSAQLKLVEQSAELLRLIESLPEARRAGLFGTALARLCSRPSAITASNPEDLVKHVAENAEAFGLRYRAEEGLFTDLGLVSALRSQAGVVRISGSNNRSLVFLPNGRSYHVYLVERASNGRETVRIIDNSLKRQSVITWLIRQNRLSKRSSESVMPYSVNFPHSITTYEISRYGNADIRNAAQLMKRVQTADPENEDSPKITGMALTSAPTLGLSADAASSRLLAMRNEACELTASESIEVPELDTDEALSVVNFAVLGGMDVRQVTELLAMAYEITEDSQQAIAATGAAVLKMTLDRREAAAVSEIRKSGFDLAKIQTELKTALKTLEDTLEDPDYGPTILLATAITGKTSASEIQVFESQLSEVYDKADGLDEAGASTLYLLSLLSGRNSLELVSLYNGLVESDIDSEAALQLVMTHILRGTDLKSLETLYTEVLEKAELWDGHAAILVDAAVAGQLTSGEAVAALEELRFHSDLDPESDELIRLVRDVFQGKHLATPSQTGNTRLGQPIVGRSLEFTSELVDALFNPSRSGSSDFLTFGMTYNLATGGGVDGNIATPF